MENIGTHDFLKPKPKQPEIIKRSYFVTRDIDKKINRMKIDRDGISVSNIVQEALEQYFSGKIK